MIRLDFDVDGPIRADEILARTNWPVLQDIEDVKIEAGEVLIACNGFEERSVEVVSKAAPMEGAPVRLVLVDYLPAYDENRKSEMLDHAKRLHSKIEGVVYDRRNPAGIGQTIVDLCGDADGYLVDISGMSRLLIVQMLVALLETGRSVTVLYAEAEDYQPSLEEYKKGALSGEHQPSYISSGLWDIAATPELGSVAMLGEAIRLIAFPSFDPSHLINLVQELQPTYTDILEGLPPRKRNAWRKSAIAELNELSTRGLSVERFDVSTLDYRETIRAVLDIYAKRSMFDRLVLSPTGSKMQAVAIGVLRAVLDDLQIVYPTPQYFVAPDRYSVGSRKLYKLDLPLILEAG